MEAVLILLAAVGGVSAIVARALRDEERWGTGTRARGSSPALVAALPAGVETSRRGRIADAQPGEYVAVIGTVVGNASLVSPLSRRLCMAWDLATHDRVSGLLLDRELRSAAFTVEDDSGRIAVDARGAFVRVPYDHHVEAIERAQLDEAVRARIPAGAWLDAHEGAVLPGIRVLVIGVVQAADGDGGYRGAASPRLQLAGGNQRPALVSALPDDLARFERRS